MIYTNDMIKHKKNKIKTIKKIIKLFTIPFIAAIIIIAIYIGYARFIKKEANISLFGFRHYIVLTGSMEPFYNVGDLVIVKETKKEDIKKDDVITFSLNNSTETISHRIIDIVNQDGQELYQTKGDNNNAPDSDLVSYENIKGKIVFKISKFGRILTELTTGTGIVVVLVITILSYIQTNRREERRIAREDARNRYNIPKYKKEDKV